MQTPVPKSEETMTFLFVCLFCFLFFKTEFLCVTALASLKQSLVDQVALNLTEICLPSPPGIKGVHHLCLADISVHRIGLFGVKVKFVGEWWKA